MKKIWIDIENTPHVIIFAPIIKDLEKEGYEIIVTAREYGGIVNLLEMNNIKYTLIGKDHGAGKLKKYIGVIKRIIQLYLFVRNKNISASASHGSRSHIGASWLAGIPSLTSYDYEHASKFMAHELTTKIIVPRILEKYVQENVKQIEKIFYYSGFKEEIYLKNYVSKKEDVIKALNLDTNKTIILVRPPAMNSHYYTEKSGALFSYLLEKLSKLENSFVIFSPRTRDQHKLLLEMTKEIKDKIILEKEVNGIDLILCCDLIFSGGGTMNRESALLGVPVFSIFGGEIGAVDIELNRQEKLQFINEKDDLDKIEFKKKEDHSFEDLKNSAVYDEFKDAMTSLAKTEFHEDNYSDEILWQVAEIHKNEFDGEDFVSNCSKEFIFNFYKRSLKAKDIALKLVMEDGKVAGFMTFTLSNAGNKAYKSFIKKNKWLILTTPEVLFPLIKTVFLKKKSTLKHRYDVELLYLVILKEYRSKGFARQLFNMTEEYYLDHSIHAYYLQVMKDNERAAQIYEKYGFEKIEEFTARNRPKILMRKNI